MLKQSSDQEISQLWTQLESMRTSRQELGGMNKPTRLKLGFFFFLFFIHWISLHSNKHDILLAMPVLSD